VISRPLLDALDALRIEFPTSRALLGDLAADAVFALASPGEVDAVLHRLLELATHHDLADRYAYEIFDLLVAEDWKTWDMPAVQAISAWADAWWATALFADEDALNAGDILGQLTHLDLPMTRWLTPWLEAIDGPGAQHLARFIVDGSDHPAWSSRRDEYKQVKAWCKSETVVNGFTMIGGVHLAKGQLAQILDRVIVAPGL